MYRYCSQVSAVDGIIAPFTSQTSPAYPTVIFNSLQNIQGLLKRLVIAESYFNALIARVTIWKLTTKVKIILTSSP
jgi:hypothetical protein